MQIMRCYVIRFDIRRAFLLIAILSRFSFRGRIIGKFLLKILQRPEFFFPFYPRDLQLNTTLLLLLLLLSLAYYHY